MSTDRETTRIVRSWLEGGVTQLPDNVLDAVLDELPATHQRRPGWTAWRPFALSKTLVFGAAAAAIVIAAIVGIGLLGQPGRNFGAPDETPIATPTPEPQALRTGSQGPGPFTTEFHSEATVENPIAFTFAMPAGWEGVRPWVIGGPATVVFVQVSGLYADPCLANRGAPDVPIGSTADELASALVAHPAYEATVTGTFTIDGYNGVRVEVETPSDIDYATCQEESFWLWDGPLYAGARSQFDIWIFDLEGTTAVVLAEVTDAQGQGRTEIGQIVESVNIQP